MLSNFEKWAVAFGNWAWGSQLLVLLVGGGLFFLIYSRLLPLRYMKHGIDILRGKYDDKDAPGDISHFQALASAIAGTVGLGNIAGVAVAFALGGPGAIFWMWVSAILGIATKFFTCSLAVMYRGKDSLGNIQGGPMYVITEGLGKKWRPLAMFFCIAAMFGVLPIFQTNQLLQISRDVIFIPSGLLTAGDDHFMFNFIFGFVLMLITASVIIGGIKRIALVASKVVPAMILLYLGAALFVIADNFAVVPGYLLMIVEQAFSPQAVGGGMLGVMIIGIRRAAFSNEAGIGTEAMAHGAAKTDHAIREGLVAMLGPVIDTLLVCTATAMVIMISGVWQDSNVSGITLTAMAFDKTMPDVGTYVLMVCVIFFSVSTVFTMAYYGTKCCGFVFGAHRQHLYNYFYLVMIIVGAVTSLDAVISIIDGMYAMMAIPTMVSALLLSPKVMALAREYFANYANEKVKAAEQSKS
ncbi:MAG: AGCS family alanine or glycine:cation symporter [Alteromonadaceae bacterium]|jgi:AGCS family alanine or glycine:cation symporter